MRPKFLIPIILILGGAIRLLCLYTPHMDSDQAVTGLMARHILGGEFPFFFYGQDYCGSIEAYLVSTVFLFLGATRFTLNLTICIESIFFILFIYYLARAIFDKETAILSALFSALASYYLIFHSVLARAAYIEIPIIGVLLFIVANKIIYRNESSGRNFLVLGFLCGLGIWTHFLIIFYLPPVFLFLFIKDPWFWIRKSFLFFLLGMVLGGLPLWIHNTVHPLVTWHYLFDTAGGDESALTSFKDFFLYRFPEALGVLNNGTRTFFIPYLSFFMYLVYLSLFLFLLLLRRKKALNLLKLRIEQSNGLDLLLFFLFLFPIIFSLSGFASAHTSRYLQPLFSVLPILLAVFTIKAKSFSVTLASLFLVFHLFSNVYGTITLLPLVSKDQTRQYRQDRKNDQNLFNFLKGKNIKRLYSTEYWISVRLTFDAQEEIIIAQPIGDRYSFFTHLVDRDPGAAFLISGDNKDFEETLINIGGTYQKSQVFGDSIYYDFLPPPYRFTELEPTNWKAVSNFNSEAAIHIFDRDLTTWWSSDAPQKAGTFLQIDLGKIVPDLGRLILLSGKPENIPRGLRLEISLDGREWQRVRELPRYWGFLSWSGPHPFYRPQEGRIDITFSPRSGRFFRLTQLGTDPTYFWSVAECFLYQAHPKSDQESGDLNPLLSYLRKLPFTNIHTTPWIDSQLPLDWLTKQKTLARQEGKEDLVQSLSNPVFVVEQETASALALCLKKFLNRPFQEHPIGGQVVFSFPPSSDRYQPLSQKNWRFQTNVNPQKAYLAADGKITTRWTTDRPQVPGTFFKIDLGQKVSVARLRLLVGNSRNDFPRGYLISYSTDGTSWASLNSILKPVTLHWTGETLLKGSEDLDFIFPSTPMRYLQIVQTGRDNVYYWSIHECEVYQKEGQ